MHTKAIYTSSEVDSRDNFGFAALRKFGFMLLIDRMAATPTSTTLNHTKCLMERKLVVLNVPSQDNYRATFKLDPLRNDKPDDQNNEGGPSHGKR